MGCQQTSLNLVSLVRQHTKREGQKTLEEYLFKINAAEPDKSGKSYYLQGKAKLTIFCVSTRKILL